MSVLYVFLQLPTLERIEKAFVDLLFTSKTSAICPLFFFFWQPISSHHGGYLSISSAVAAVIAQMRQLIFTATHYVFLKTVNSRTSCKFYFFTKYLSSFFSYLYFKILLAHILQNKKIEDTFTEIFKKVNDIDYTIIGKLFRIKIGKLKPKN